MKVLVLGCGPSGLLATHAAAELGEFQVIIASRKRRSELFGCQYLHEAIPGVSTEADAQALRYELRGTVEEYAAKVYGPHPPGLVSPQLYVGTQEAWDIRAAYDWLWNRYNDLVIDAELRAPMFEEMVNTFRPDIVLSTIPARSLCRSPERHVFRSTGIWALGDAPALGQRVPYDAEPNTVTCDSTKAVSWYRLSNVFGHTTVEFPGHRSRPPLENVVAVEKPLSTDCDCWPDVVRLGRFGQWKKGVLAHEAYVTAKEHLRSVQERVG